ncbi:TraI/MobA(P) family conjugative relaxase [Sulfurovum sp. NBC37-1]|uniref:TraI/MobA(P) family conjugative relaxase n=1 Tax=Sulfurovum sp. (strain NBC37-1) TaxID=387093 RepID=UPI0001587B55|nr:TraI/MobA(P) family conjugative relaxase [Sulfurovum sp. NBC37-1]BAF73380.1 DNA relaxase TraI [Sulfurovum sp. NBC37-1]
MIVKKIAAKKGTGSFGGLANYILDKSNDGAKAEEITFSNCPYDNTEQNIAFIQSMQSLNQRTTRDKTLHLVVSFPEAEKPSYEQLQDIENVLLKSIGMAEHPRLSVTHTNTANYHLHIAVSRIDPITLNRSDPHRDIPKLHQKAEELEEKHRLKKDNHTPNYLLEKAGIVFKPKQHSKPKDIAIHSGVDSLLTWIKEEALDNIKEILKDPKSSLEDLHQVLADHNLELKPRGNGIVIADKTRKLFVKASDVHRDLSKGKLEKRYGEFKTSKITTTPKKKFGRPVNEYWKRYQELSTQKRSTKTEELRLEKLARTMIREQLKKKYEARINKIKADPLINKRHKAQAQKKVHEQRKAELTALNETFSKKRKEIYSSTKQTSYKEYLMELALSGDEGALKELRKQKQEIKPDDKVLMHPKKEVSHSIFKSFISKVTKQGNAVYQVGKNSTVTDKGDHLKLSLESKSDEAMLQSLKMAVAKYGNTLDIQGNLEFKKRVLMATQKYDLKVNFADPQMQKIKTETQTRADITKTPKKGMQR